MTFSLYPLLVAKFQLIDVSALFNEVIFENGGNRKPVFYGQVPVKVIETFELLQNLIRNDMYLLMREFSFKRKIINYLLSLLNLYRSHLTEQ